MTAATEGVDPGRPSARLWLVVESPGGDVLKVAAPTDDEQLLVGRDPTCALVLKSPEVSRHHATFTQRDGTLFFTDTSANGTAVGNTLVRSTTTAVGPGTALSLGKYIIRIVPRGPGEGDDLGPRAGTDDVSAAVRRDIHRRLIDHLDLVKLERNKMNNHLLRAKVRLALQEIVATVLHLLPADTDTEQLVLELTDEALGLGPLEGLLADPLITEIMVVDPRTIYIEREGDMKVTGLRFTDDESVRSALERIVTPLGRRIDESSPMLDARLPDGSRVNAVIPPLALRGTCITIRKFAKDRWTGADLVGFGTMTDRMERFLARSVTVRKNIVVSGGTGTGKTTLLNVLSSAIPARERVVTIEDSAELRLSQPHVVSLEGRPANMEGGGLVSIRDLVKNAMRMRPDRILVGECRGGEALDMLQAMNTGHEGSMTTTHANSAFEALKRIETLVLMADVDLPSRAVREQIAASVDLVVQLTRFSDGSRRITSIAELAGLDDDGQIEVREIFGFRRTDTRADGGIVGEFYTTGYLPSFLHDFIVHGLVAGKRGDYL
jgi:pilus assembly protein CpaF